MDRPPWDQYFMGITKDVATRASCSRHKIGCIIVNHDKELVATGYNGNPRGMDHCDVIGCVRDERGIPSGERMEVCTAVHAEMNALIQAGRASKGSTLYCTVLPCNTCAKMIINAGIKRVVYHEEYPEKEGGVLLKQLGIEVKRI